MSALSAHCPLLPRIDHSHHSLSLLLNGPIQPYRVTPQGETIVERGELNAQLWSSSTTHYHRTHPAVWGVRNRSTRGQWVLAAAIILAIVNSHPLMLTR
jgi:hypothetical protein